MKWYVVIFKKGDTKTKKWFLCQTENEAKARAKAFAKSIGFEIERMIVD